MTKECYIFILIYYTDIPKHKHLILQVHENICLTRGFSFNLFKCSCFLPRQNVS